jgi:hypothetical protein
VEFLVGGGVEGQFVYRVAVGIDAVGDFILHLV